MFKVLWNNLASIWLTNPLATVQLCLTQRCEVFKGAAERKCNFVQFERISLWYLPQLRYSYEKQILTEEMHEIFKMSGHSDVIWTSTKNSY